MMFEVKGFFSKVIAGMILLGGTVAASVCSAETQYALLKDPVKMRVSVGGTEHVFRCYFADEKQRHTYFLRHLITTILDCEFERFKISVPEDKLEPIVDYYLKGNKIDAQKKAELVEVTTAFFKNLYEGLQLAKEKKLTPDEVYEQYWRKKADPITINEWHKYYNLYYSEKGMAWFREYFQASREKKAVMSFSPSLVQAIKIFLLDRKISAEYEALDKTQKQAGTKDNLRLKIWNNHLQSLKIEVPAEFAALKDEALQTVRQAIASNVSEKHSNPGMLYFIKLLGHAPSPEKKQ